MPLYVCERCRSVENTALGRYWGAGEKLCSACATGTWHGHFPRRTYAAERDGPVGPGRILAQREPGSAA